MRRSTAAALLGLFILGMGLLCSSESGRRGLQNLATAQVDDVLDTIAVTQNQRLALERVRQDVVAEINARVEQLQNLIRCALDSRSPPRGRFHLVSPPNVRTSELRALPFLVRSTATRSCSSSSYLPPRRAAVAAEWRSCCSVAPR
ncbi:MAG TPA: hypothetical protein VKB87_15745 [Myxococcaceae bacterium]|nr:hypothetical protein [Myxococcaceae bacterium]